LIQCLKKVGDTPLIVEFNKFVPIFFGKLQNGFGGICQSLILQVLDHGTLICTEQFFSGNPTLSDNLQLYPNVIINFLKNNLLNV
jgi:hypothetical protein